MVVPEQPADAALVERRIVTVLFADLVGFTPLSERLDAEDMATIQNAYFATTRETIERYGGVLEKFIGDAAMAVFGAPIGRDDDAERAVRAGMALIGAIGQLGARLGLEPGELELRVGVNSGEVVHATTGPDAGRVTGDTINTAARLQSAARPGTVLVGELTALAVAETIDTASVGTVELKGKAEAVRCWEAVAPRPQRSREEALGAMRAPMLGRDAEMERLQAAAARVTDQPSAGRIVVIAPPGVGKSRLLAEFAAGVAGTAGTVLRGRVRPQATAPYETVVQLIASAGSDRLGAALADAGVPASRGTVIQDEVTRLFEGVDAATGASGDLAVEREARFDAWISAIDALATGPQVWLVEDVHWAGGDLLAFLERAGTASAPRGRLVVATARPSLLDTAPDWSDVDRLELAPLPATDAAALIEALIGPALPAALVRAVVERSDGNPLFIEELIRTWVSVGTLVPDGDAWRLSVQPDAVPLPPTVQAIYAAQLDDLPPDARLLARRGAVAGRRVPVGALEALEIGTTDGLDRLRRRTLLAGPVHDAITGEAYVYRHALLRDAGYASLARVERRRLHVAMAGWLAAIAGSRADIVAEAVAEHYAIALDNRSALAAAELPARATLAVEAAAWFERAAEAALRLSAHEACCRLLARSIELTDPPATLDLGRRRRRLGEVLAASADLDAGVAELEAALACCPDDPASVAASAYALARAYMQQIRFAEAERLSAETIASLAGQPEALLTRLHALHAWAVSAQGRIDGVLEEADAARATARAGDDPILDLEVLEHVAAARDEVDASTNDHWVELEERARSLGRWHQVVTAARARAMRQSVEDPAAAVAVMEEAADLARTHGLVEQAGWCDYVRSELLWVIGAWDEAIALGDAVTVLAERNGYQRLAFRTYVVLLPMAAERRDADLAGRFRAWREGAAAHFPATPSPYARLLNAAIEIWLAEAAGKPSQAPAAEVVDSIIPMINPHFVAAVETVVRTWLAAGLDDLAGLGADRVAEFAADDDATPLIAASSALLAAWLGRADAGVAVTAARAIGAEWWVARALRASGSADAAAQLETRLGIPPG